MGGEGREAKVGRRRTGKRRTERKREKKGRGRSCISS